MLMDAHELPPQSQLDCDIVIVGAGAAGVPLAHEFLNTSLSVILLESGGFRSERETQDLYKGQVLDPERHGPLDKYRRRCFGGTTTVWGGRCAPFDEIDFERRPHVPHSGWPLSRHDMDPFYQRAHVYCDVGHYTYDAADALRNADAPMIPGFESDDIAQTTIWRFSPPSNFAKLSAQAFKDSANIRLCLHANCTGIRLNKQGNHVAGLRVVTLRGNEFTVHARYYVLAMGGLEVTRLLLASNDVCSAGIGNDHDLVGRFYSSHITGELGTAVFTPKGAPIIWDYERSHEGVYCRRSLSIREPAQRREQLLNFRCTLSHPPIHDPAHGSSILSAAYLVKRFLIHKIPPEYSKDLAGHMTPYRRALPHLRNVALRWPALIPFSFKWVAKRLLARRKLPSVSLFNRRNVYSLHFDAEQAPNPESRITLTDERDALGVPRLRVDWRHSDLDIESVARIWQLIRRDLRNSGVATVQREEGSFAERILAQLGVGSHHIGTTRMAGDPSRGVVDSNCRVHGLDNLFIASSSTFPTASFANPTLTIVAFAVRVAEYLKTLSTGPV